MVTTSPIALQTAPQLPNHKVKYKKAGQRACNEKDAKGKICAGHLKRWAYTVDVKEIECGDLEAQWGAEAEVYRCEPGKALYLPNPEDPSGRNVAGMGQLSHFGLTLPPKTNQPGTYTPQTGVDAAKQVAKALPKDNPEPPKP